MVCSGGQSCPPVASFEDCELAGVPPGAGGDDVSCLKLLHWRPVPGTFVMSNTVSYWLAAWALEVLVVTLFDAVVIW